MNLTPEEKADGRENYYEAIGVSRRDFFQQTIATGAVGAAGIGAAYFGYTQVDRPVRIGVIGTGDEGNVLIGAMNPAYHQVVAIADIRPSSIHRAFHGDWASPAANAARKGLMKVYDWKTEDKARENVKVYDASNGGYEELLKDKDVEAIVIALPLHLHAKAAADAMKAGKHVLTEKLMAHNVAQCKAMGRIADEKDLYLAVGHQRHYSVLYDNAVNLIRWGILGEIHHIRAQWHRGNLPGRDSWQQPLPGGEPIRGSQKTYDKIADQLRSLTNKLKKPPTPEEAELLRKKVAQWTAWDSDKTVDAAAHGYESMMLPGDRERSALEELIRWRLWARTGGGLMATPPASLSRRSARTARRRIRSMCMPSAAGTSSPTIEKRKITSIACSNFPRLDTNLDSTRDTKTRCRTSRIPSRASRDTAKKIGTRKSSSLTRRSMETDTADTVKL